MRADRLPAIHHVQTAMPEGGEVDARRFYGDLIGLSEIEKPEPLRSRGGVWFQSGTLQLHLGVDRDFSPATKAHVAFEVADIAATRQRCLAGGHPVRDDDDLPGYTRFYTDDPFGNRVEILQPQVAPSAAIN